MSTIESKVKSNLDYFLEICKNSIFRKVTKFVEITRCNHE